MSERTPYPYVPGEFGIPLQDFPVGFEYLILGGSGRYLECTLLQREIRIIALDDEVFKMTADVLDDGTLQFDLHTKKYDIQERHPDMYAAHFIKYSLRYFQANGIDVSCVRSYWDQNSINYHSFMKRYSEIKDENEAAKQTWSGKIMARHGFTEVREISIDLYDISTTFFRE